MKERHQRFVAEYLRDVPQVVSDFTPFPAEDA
ncbi:MAG: hypothetical protein JWL84_3561 [Rhodospirillales bacterium]|jgi:hypothetical protein|nr:hypothetical protein [Rhodospirillales bacterium]